MITGVPPDDTETLEALILSARPDNARLTEHLGPVVQKDTLLISDGEKAYGAFAAAHMLLHVWIIASKGEHVWQGYHIQNVNAYTSALKTWMVRFKSVATKYLDSYLGWRRMIDRDGDDLPADRWLIAAVQSHATS